jgi:lipid-A-disaccharide synthase
MKIGIVAGEASGDLLGAGLLSKLHAIHPDLKASGIGGQAMIREGFQSLYEMDRLSVMGLVEPLFRLSELFKIRRRLYEHFISERPDVVIGIDSPDFNLGLEIKLRKAGIPVVHYVSPSVWAWRKKRIFKIAKAVDLMLTLFPFEAQFYRDHHIPVQFVGHPLADTIPLNIDKPAARETLGLSPDALCVALFPGSRYQEVKYHAELFIKTAQHCLREIPALQFVTSAINISRDEEFRAYCKQWAPDLPIHFFIRKSADVMAAADVVLVKSGTSTLETLLHKRPMVIAHRMSPMTYHIAKHLVKIPHIGLPNLLANERVVPEFIQDAAEPLTLAAAILDYLKHPEKIQAVEQRFLAMHQQLRGDANDSAAKAIIPFLKK